MIGLTSFNSFGGKITISGSFYKGTVKYYNFHCDSCKNNPEMVYETFTCRIDHFKSGKVGCGCNPYYRRSDRGELLQLNNFIKNNKILDKTFTDVIRKDNKKFYKYFCNVCSQDTELFPELSMLKGEVKRLHFPCNCGSKVFWTQRQYKVLTERYCLKNNYTLLDFNNARKHGDKVYLLNNRNKLKWWVSLRDLLQGKRDPTQTGIGFNPSKPAHFYIVRWYGYGESYIKFGITNREVLDRISEQDSASKHLDYEILRTFYHESGQRVADCESLLKDTMERGVCPKELLPDGFTETILDTQDNIDVVLSHVNKYLLEGVL